MYKGCTTGVQRVPTVDCALLDLSRDLQFHGVRVDGWNTKEYGVPSTTTSPFCLQSAAVDKKPETLEIGRIFLHAGAFVSATNKALFLEVELNRSSHSDFLGRDLVALSPEAARTLVCPLACECEGRCQSTQKGFSRRRSNRETLL